MVAYMLWRVYYVTIMNNIMSPTGKAVEFDGYVGTLPSSMAINFILVIKQQYYRYMGCLV